MTPLLSARSASLAGRLQPTDLTLEGPQLVCLIGPNGSGKTSLLHAVAGIGDVGGEVRVEGLVPADLSADRRKRLLAYLPASRDSAWPLTAGDLVSLGLPARAAAGEAEAAMELLELAPFAGRRVDQLSTGERSRVLIARALAPRPRLLLLDEPAANLDPLWQLRLMELLRAATHEHAQGAIVAMHDLELAARYADRLVLMDGGRIVSDGEPAAILASAALGEVFGIRKVAGQWQPLSQPARQRSSR